LGRQGIYGSSDSDWKARKIKQARDIYQEHPDPVWGLEEAMSNLQQSRLIVGLLLIVVAAFLFVSGLALFLSFVRCTQAPARLS